MCLAHRHRLGRRPRQTPHPALSETGGSGHRNRTALWKRTALELSPELRPRAATAPATDAPLRPGRSYPRAAHHRPPPRPREPRPLGEMRVAPPSHDAGRAGSSRARPDRDVPRALRHRPRTTRADPCTTPAGGVGQPCVYPRTPPRYGAEEPSPPLGPQSCPNQVHGLGPDAALAVVDAPRPPVECSARSGCRARRRAPPPGPNAGARTSPVGACGAARYAFPRSPPADSRWGLSPGAVFVAPCRGASTTFFFVLHQGVAWSGVDGPGVVRHPKLRFPPTPHKGLKSP